MCLNLFIVDRAESIEFNVINIDFVILANFLDRSTKSFDDDGYFIQINNDVFVERLSFVLHISYFLLNLFHSTVFHICFVTFETNLLLQ